MEWGIGPGDMHIATLIGLGQWVGYLMWLAENVLNRVPRVLYIEYIWS